MATIIWCDHIKHVVYESRSEVARLIDRVQRNLDDSESEGIEPKGFAFFSNAIRVDGERHQRALNVRLISSFEARPGDPV